MVFWLGLVGWCWLVGVGWLGLVGWWPRFVPEKAGRSRREIRTMEVIGHPKGAPSSSPVRKRVLSGWWPHMVEITLAIVFGAT